MMHEQDQKFPLRFAYVARILLFIFAGAVPLWFLPWQMNVDFGREITFLLLILTSFIAWLLSGLLSGRFRLVRSSALYLGAAFLLVSLVSALVSKRPFAAAFFGDPSSEKWSTLLAGFLVMVVAANVFASQKDITRALVIFLLAAGAQAAMTFFSLAFHLSLFRVIASFVQGDDFNVIGTANGAALLYAAALMAALGFMFVPAFRKLQSWLRWAMYMAVFFFAANLFLIHFRTAWMLLFGMSIVFSGFMFWMFQRNRQAVPLLEGSRAGLSLKYAVSLLVLACSMVMLMVSSPLVGRVSLPTEVSPAAVTTLRVARAVYREGVAQTLFGSGPATFDRDWARYKDAAINRTPFWGTRFNQGYSWITTLAATSGIIGIVSFLLFVVGLLLVSLRTLLAMRHDNADFLVSAFLGFLGMVFVAGIYPANLAFVLLLFFFAGLVLTGLSIPSVAEASPVFDTEAPTRRCHTWFWNISEHWFEFQQPWAVFSSSLAVVLLLSLSIGMVYYEVTRMQSALAQTSGQRAIAKGDLDTAIGAFERAAGYENKNTRLYQALVQLRTEKIRTLVAAASQGKNVQSDFQQTLSAAIQNSQSAVALSPEDPTLWQTQGTLYETIIPFIPGADNLAFSSYRKEIEFDPLNPGARINLARAGLVAGDRIQLAINQARQGQIPGADIAQLNQTRNEILERVEKILQEAVGLKPDLAATHFLLAQTALRAGNMQKAIQSTEQTKLAAPFDIGVAFQLGLLYYQNNNLEFARVEFERAVSLNQQYSNARYFLGLIHSRLGNTEAAIAQFAEVEKYNTDNQEVKQILNNLRSGKPALDGIAPPAAPPEARNQPPVAESGQSSGSSSPTPRKR